MVDDLEVVTDGLPLFNGAQLAIDTTLVSPERADGLSRRQCAHVDGAALAQARRVKQHTYPELSGNHGRARLFSQTRSVPRILGGRARQAWHHRWSSMLACASARAFALSLLDRRAAVGSDGVPHLRLLW